MKVEREAAVPLIIDFSYNSVSLRDLNIKQTLQRIYFTRVYYPAVVYV